MSLSDERASSGAKAGTSRSSLWRLPDGLDLVAQRDLGETPAKREQALKDLRERVASMHDREKFDDLSDEYLIRFLRARKFNLDRTHELILNLQKFKVENVTWFEKLRAELFRPLYKSGFMRVLAAPDKLGRRVVLISVRNIPLDMEVMTSVRMIMWIFERLSRDPYYQVNGVVFVEDFSAVRLADYVRLSNLADISMKIKGLHYMQKCAPFRMKGIFTLHEPLLVKGIFLIILRPFLAPKLAARPLSLYLPCYSRVHFMGEDTGVLRDLFSEGRLPKELGGPYQEEPAGMEWFDAQVVAEAEEERAACAQQEAVTAGGKQ